ncbi:hypothetical protein [Caulobacter sp. DWR2-3-1b2]|uniref:hypothetical protein n=1 Tax=unclassified Caulobacter TaxID=2648921 RepID=UPI0019A9A161|nr:hypothetical protein [Caulobacter sp.]
MRTSICGAVAMMATIAAFSGSALAQQPAPTTPVAGQMATKAFLTLDTPIAVIVADPAGKAVLDKDVPGLTDHPLYDSFKTLSLKELQPKMGGGIGDDAMAATARDLAALDLTKKR